MKKLFCFLLAISSGLFFISKGIAQGVSITSSGSSPDPSAMLDVSSTSKGLLIPRLTSSERDDILLPAQSLLIYNTTSRCYEFFEYGAWQQMFCAVCPAPAAVAADSHIATQTQITWNWNSVAGALGYRWNTSNNFGTATDIGNSTSVVQTNLICNSSYSLYVWAYNACGNSVVTTLIQSTDTCPNTCGYPYTDTRDSKVYATVQIGTQCWMSQGLNYGTRINASIAQSNNSTAEKYCYNDLEANCTTYGGLYQWAEVVQYLNGASNSASWSPIPTGNVQGICPMGWHLPSEAEVIALENFLGGASIAGGHMKTIGTTFWNSPNTSADNSSGFNSLGAGNINSGSSTQQGINNPFWTATQSNATGARFHMTTYSSAQAFSGDGGKMYGYMVRCLKD